MFELIIYTLFYLVFPTAPETSTLPSDVPVWEPQYWHGTTEGGFAGEYIDELLYGECERDPVSCMPPTSTFGSFLENPVAFILEG